MTRPSSSTKYTACLSNYLRTTYYERYTSVVGTVDTIDGIVGVSCTYTHEHNMVRMWVIIGGVEYTRFYNRRYKERFLVTLARRLACDASDFHSQGDPWAKWE